MTQYDYNNEKFRERVEDAMIKMMEHITKQQEMLDIAMDALKLIGMQSKTAIEIIEDQEGD